MMIKKIIIIIAVIHGFETFDHNGNDDGNAATLIKIGLNIGAFILFELISCFI